MWLVPYLHDQTLNGFRNIPIPAKTQEVDNLSQVGQQSGNSDRCDYLATLLLKTDLSQPELEKYFANNYKGKSQLNYFWVNEPHKPGIGAVNPTNILTLDDWVNITVTLYRS
jgi:hypothetical protein